MRWLDLRQAWRAGTGTALLVAGLAACGGGGGNGGTGPDGGDVGPIAGGYALATIDGAAVPIIINFDHCDNVQFQAGAMTLGEDGTWQFALKMVDADGNPLDDAQDHGRFSRANDQLAFQSDVYGDKFKGAIQAQQVHVYYDWCGEGHADVDFTFSN